MSSFFFRVSINTVANVAQGFTGVILIYFATNILDPNDYGIFGIASAILGLATSLCEIGASYVLYSKYYVLDVVERARLQSTLLIVAFFLGLLLSIIIILIWPILTSAINFLSHLTKTEFILMLLLIPLKTLWGIVSPLLIVRSHSVSLAISLLTQTAINAIVVLVCLYEFQTDRAALFWGHSFGLLACLLVSFISLGSSIWVRPKLIWLYEVKRVALRAWFSGVVENVRGALESFIVAGVVGTFALGNYNHARTYQTLLTQSSNAFGNVLWPIALNEARNTESGFKRIQRPWDFVYVALTCFGIGSVLFGYELINMLTHGKFLLAASWLPWLVIYVLLQNSGKPATAILFAFDKSNVYSEVRIISLFMGMIGLVIFVPFYGVAAVIGILIVEIVLTRLLVFHFAKKYSNVPFQDHWVLIGVGLILGLWFLSQLINLNLLHRAVLLFILIVGLFLGVIFSTVYLRLREK